MDPILIGLAISVAGAVAVLWFAVSAGRRALEAVLEASQSELRRLADSAAWRERDADELRREVSAFRESLDQLRVREEERRGREEQGWTHLQRISSVLAGGQRAGRAGENVLREALASLPPTMVVTDFRVNGRVVEFGLVLPDGKRLPIDSKWPAERDLVRLGETEDSLERERLVKVVEKTVVDRAREVAGYRDPAVTAPLGVAAIPDAAYAVLRRAHAEAYRQGVIVIPYSMALPILLFLYGVVARFGMVGDVSACLTELSASLDAMECTLENKVSKASTMLANGAEELRGQVGKARTTLSRTRQASTAMEESQPPTLVAVPN